VVDLTGFVGYLLPLDGFLVGLFGFGL